MKRNTRESVLIERMRFAKDHQEYKKSNPPVKPKAKKKYTPPPEKPKEDPGDLPF